MAELVDARDLKSLGAMPRVGSSPTSGIDIKGFPRIKLFLFIVEIMNCARLALLIGFILGCRLF